uniref:Uncharacterized protein n=1 Tax=Ciona savignyi TaxID=51511 RepID=H2ZD50_CIOSA
MHRPDRPYNDEGRSEEGKDDHHHRKPNKYDSRPQEKMNSSEPKRDRQRKEFSEKAHDEKFDRREKDQYNRSDKDRYNKSDRHDRNDRYDNRNKGKEQQQDGKRENVDRRDKGRPFNSSQPSQNKRKESPRRPASKPTHKSDEKVEKSEAENPPISTVINTQVKQPVVEAAPPPTNIWEERKRQMQKDVDKTTLTYIPTEEDKKRTLKETAPVKSEELVFFNKGLLSEKAPDENKPVPTTIPKDNYS